MKKFHACFVAMHFFFAAHAQSFTSSNLPLVVINTNGQTITDEPKIMADMGIVFNAGEIRNNIQGPFNHYNGKIGIEIRGQSSQQFPMKSYSIELRNSSGNSIDRSLFGLPAESDWVLYAPYNEKTLMRNFLAYTISREMGHWAPNCRYVEVVINGEYKGIYVLIEKIKRGSGRVNIAKLNTSDITNDNVTGGYIFSIDKDANGWFSDYAAGQRDIHFSYVYPKENNIVAAQETYIKTYTDSFENALKSSQYQHKQTGWRKYADENSFINYLLVNEVSRNVDGYRISSYFHKDRYSKGGKIKAGPVWDYDLAFRNANYCNGSEVAGWAYQFNAVCPGDFWQVPFWWTTFSTDTAFQNNLRCRWQQLKTTTLNKNHLFHLIDSIATLTSEARQRHFQQWPVLGKYIWPNPSPIATTYEDEIQTLKTWLEARLNWLDNNIPNTGGCAVFPANNPGTFIISNFPNPFYGNQIITIQSALEQQILIRVIGAAGSTIQSNLVTLQAGFNRVPMTTSYWAKGLYIIGFTSATGEKQTRKVIR